MRRFFSSLFIFLLTACSSEIVVKEESAALVSMLPKAFIIKEEVNLRAGHHLKSDIIGKMKDGDALYILKNKAGWYNIKTDEGKTGWVRSDMAGPKELCRTCLAGTFADSIMPAFRGDIFFDKKETYKVIYLTFEDEFYDSEQKARNQAKKTGAAYQKKVYPGAVEIRVLKPESNDLFTKVGLPAIGLADLPVPVLSTGYILSLNEQNNQVALSIAVPAEIAGNDMLNLARSVSAVYDYPINKVEIHLRAETDYNKCLLYYLEDKDGEFYEYDCK